MISFQAHETPRPASTIRWRRLWWLLLYGAIIAGILLHRAPLRLPPPEVGEKGGSAFHGGATQAPALLLLPPAFTGDGPVATPPPSRFSQTAWDQAWGNLLLQEMGAFRALPLASLGATELASAALVVVPAGCAGALSAPAVQMLETFAHDGGVVIFEQSGSVDSSAASADWRISWCAEGLLDEETRRQLPPVSLPATAAEPVAELVKDAWEPLVRASRDGSEVTLFATRRLGQGGYLAIAFDLARHLVIWQQGLPADDFTIPPRHRREAGVSFTQPNALVAEREFLSTLFPHADAIERLVLACVETIRPVPRLWCFPAAFDGAFTMTHDDENFGDLSRWMTADEKRQGAASTLYIIPDRITPAGCAAMAEDGADLALHWWRGWSGDMTRAVSLLGWTPARRVLSLTEQQGILREKSGDAPVTSNRVHGLMWDAHYTRDFRRLEAAGFVLDSTYGPAGPEQLGYQFGTGFPFHPLDTDGRPFQLLEIPFLYQDDENWRPTLDEELLAASAGSLHELLVPLYHCTTMRWKPSTEVMDGYLAAFERARTWNHWVTTLTGYHRFWLARTAPIVARDGAPGAYRVAATSAGDNRQQQAEATELALLVPQTAMLRAADGTTPTARAISLHGRPYRVVALSALGGGFTLEAGR